MVPQTWHISRVSYLPANDFSAPSWQQIDREAASRHCVASSSFMYDAYYFIVCVGCCVYECMHTGKGPVSMCVSAMYIYTFCVCQCVYVLPVFVGFICIHTHTDTYGYNGKGGMRVSFICTYYLPNPFI